MLIDEWTSFSELIVVWLWIVWFILTYQWDKQNINERDQKAIVLDRRGDSHKCFHSRFLFITFCNQSDKDDELCPEDPGDDVGLGWIVDTAHNHQHEVLEETLSVVP